MQQKGSLSIAWNREDKIIKFTAHVFSADRHFISWQHSPSVVLSVEQEVCAHNGDTHGHDA